MEKILSLSPEKRAAMGLKGREKMCNEFDESIVLGRYLETVKELAILHNPRNI
jgi:hypothetical protein